MADSATVSGLEIRGPAVKGSEEILTAPAMELVVALQREFDTTRRQLLEMRARRQAELDAGGSLDFLSATRSVREDDWRIAPLPRPAGPAGRDHRSGRTAR